MKETFERFIKYLCVAGVAFAALYVIFPELTKNFLNTSGAILGPILVVALLILAIFIKPRQTTK